MNLKPRFLLLTLLLFICAAIPSWLAVRSLAEGIFEQWAQRYAEKQALYDKSRTLQPILREVALARQMAASPALVEWAREPGSEGKKSRALTEMERFRQNLGDHSYFIGLRKDGRYYYNNARNEYTGNEFRYVLRPEQGKDAWFFDLIRQQRDMHINVNPDPELGLTKLWIDVLIRDGSDILGIVGTGMDLTSFLQNVVDVGGTDVTTLFVDHDGAIQLHCDQTLIEFNSISKQGLTHRSLDLLLDREADRQSVLAAMKQLETGKRNVLTRFVEIRGKRHLVGIVYVPEIDWYEITLLDVAELLPLRGFVGIVAAYGMTLALVLLLFNLALGYYVLRPLRGLDRAMARVEAGNDVSGALTGSASGEIGRLLRRFARMAQSVTEARRDLEAKVQERTLALDELSKTDPLTGVLNRRGMTGYIEAELARAEREHSRVGILWVDVDFFKEINDSHGHAVGDEVLCAVATTIRATIRPYDQAARWGGDEFLVLIQASEPGVLDILGERLRNSVQANAPILDEQGQTVKVSVSVGGYLAVPGEALDSVLAHGDQALYAAKTDGRDCYRRLAA